MTEIPTLDSLYQKMVSKVETKLGVSLPEEGKVYLRADAIMISGELKQIYYALGLVQKNIYPDTADEEFLKRWGKIKINRFQIPATQGFYTCSVSGSAAAVISQSTQFQSDDDSSNPGYLFNLDADYTLTGTGDTIILRALTSGLESKLQVGDTLTATQPIIGVDAVVTVTAVATTPTASELLSEYRERTLESFRLLPQGGAPADYRLWGKTNIAGVSQVYPYNTSGAANEIDLYVEATVADSTDGKGTPTSTILTNVETAVEAVRPMTVIEVHYLPVVPIGIAISITSTNFTTAQENLIETAMEEAIAKIRPFIAGADVLADRNDTFSQNNVINVILNVIPGAQFGAVTLSIPDSPPTTVASYQFDRGEIPYLATITFA